MKDKFYGRIEQTEARDDTARHVEEITVRGLTVVRDCFALDELAARRRKIDGVYEQQEKEFGREALAAIHELDACRAPVLYDFDFIQLATHPKVLAIVREFLGDWFILNLQNATIVRPGVTHHQSSWHRDLPYQNGIASRPLAINALLAIDEFSADTGGTQVVPFTHKTDVLPSDSYIECNRITASAPAGSALVFDSMLFHRAGFNRSSGVRRSVNHLYTLPLIKQQYDFPRALQKRESGLEPSVARLLGFTSQVPLDDKTWRLARAARLQGKV
jgi:ectoine hydroxylase-related dioxygenase (phytanoyl-CoA dioxygenase family)